jgi:hypothetical protein
MILPFLNQVSSMFPADVKSLGWVFGAVGTGSDGERVAVGPSLTFRVGMCLAALGQRRGGRLRVEGSDEGVNLHALAEFAAYEHDFAAARLLALESHPSP